jgi:hypothetical protein
MPKRNDDVSSEKHQINRNIVGVYQPILSSDQKLGEVVPPRGGTGVRGFKSGKKRLVRKRIRSKE